MAAEPRAAAGQPLPRPAALPAPPGPISGPIPAAGAPLSLRRGAPGLQLPAAPVAAAPAGSGGRRGQAPALTGRSRHFRQRRRPPPHDGLGAGRAPRGLRGAPVGAEASAPSPRGAGGPVPLPSAALLLGPQPGTRPCLGVEPRAAVTLDKALMYLQSM